MKTTILNLAMALFTVASLSSPALADPTASRAFPRAGDTSRSLTRSKLATSHVCKTDACCATKTTTAGIGGGRSAKATFKKVVICDKSCSVAAKDQRAACGKGMKA